MDTVIELVIDTEIEGVPVLEGVLVGVLVLERERELVTEGDKPIDSDTVADEDALTVIEGDDELDVEAESDDDTLGVDVFDCDGLKLAVFDGVTVCEEDGDGIILN